MKLRKQADEVITRSLAFGAALIVIGCLGLWWQGKPGSDIALFAVMATLLIAATSIIGGLFADMHLSNEEGREELRRIQKETEERISRRPGSWPVLPERSKE